jgi:hypothetical protein
MSGSLLQQARKDAQNIIKSGGFEEEIQLTNPSGFLINIKGLHSKHWLQHDTDGNLVNGKNAHICISEQELNSLGYATRNERTGNIELQNHKVATKDSTGIVKNYVINECFPSETFGLIVCILGDLKL